MPPLRPWQRHDMTCELVWNCWHFRQFRTWIHDNHCDLTIESDTGQHLQYLQCLLVWHIFWQSITTLADQQFLNCIHLWQLLWLAQLCVAVNSIAVILGLALHDYYFHDSKIFSLGVACWQPSWLAQLHLATILVGTFHHPGWSLVCHLGGRRWQGCSRSRGRECIRCRCIFLTNSVVAKNCVPFFCLAIKVNPLGKSFQWWRCWRHWWQWWHKQGFFFTK